MHTTKNVFSARFLLTLLLPLGILCGCGGSDGPELASVAGKLTKGGKPLASISVTFTPVSGAISSAALTDSEGKFVLISATGKAGAAIGKHKVVLSSKSATDSPVGYEAMMKARQSSEGGKNGALKEQKSEQMFPPEYSDASKTPLEYEVKTGSNDFDIVIP